MSSNAASPMSSFASSAGRGPGKSTSFVPELQSMMFALGDARRPLHVTASLVEDVVHTQLIHLLQQAAEVSQLRGARVITAEDILFLMRKDKKKMKRLLKYMVFRDYKSKILKSIDDEEALETDKFSSISVNKRQKLAHDFLSSIDQTGDFLALFDDDDVDEVKQERLEAHLHGLSVAVKSNPDSPENTPPSTPSTPASGQQSQGKSHSSTLGNGGLGHNSSSKAKQRKRKKSAAACGLEAQNDAIQPVHIREAIRRYSHKVGPLSPFTSAYHRNGMTFLAC